MVQGQVVQEGHALLSYMFPADLLVFMFRFVLFYFFLSPKERWSLPAQELNFFPRSSQCYIRVLFLENELRLPQGQHFGVSGSTEKNTGGRARDARSHLRVCFVASASASASPQRAGGRKKHSCP